MSIRFAKSAIIFLLLSTGCASDTQREMTTTPLPSVFTSTLPVLVTPAPSETMVPPPPQPTIAPVDGVTSTQVNVRDEPSTAGAVLGIIPPDMRVEIIGKDPGGNWWQINYPAGVEGKGWVTGQYITAGDTSQVPVIGGTETDPPNGNVAIVQQQINVRSGPGTDFNSLGTLNPQDVISLTGKDPNGAWLQIDFPAGTGPDGKGWVNAAFVQAQGVENLPIVTESGVIVGTGTPTGIPATPTPTVIPAREDGDSSDSPIVSVIFEPNGTQTLIYSGDISVPQGDREDWVAFRPYAQFVYASLECQGSDAIEIQMLENNLPADTYINCGDQRKQLSVNASSHYLIHLQAVSAAANLQYTNYILTIKMRP